MNAFSISSAKIQEINDTRKSACHFFIFYAIPVTFLIKKYPLINLDKLRITYQLPMRPQGSPKDHPWIAQGWMPIFDKSVLYMYIYKVYIQFLFIILYLHMSKKSCTFAA